MKKAVSLLLALALSLGLAVPALADQSTTTVRTAYKDLDPRTEIYAVTQTPGSDYPYYGAKNEPNGGVYYGRTTQGGTLSDGSFGLANYSHMTGESAVSFYYSLTDSYNLEYWSYLYGPALRDGTRAFLLYLNFEEEGAECPRIVSGGYDAKLIETFGYLNTLSCPVFVRIGGEMNVGQSGQAGGLHRRLPARGEHRPQPGPPGGHGLLPQLQQRQQGGYGRLLPRRPVCGLGGRLPVLRPLAPQRRH